MRQAVSSIAITAAGLLVSSWGATVASAAAAKPAARPPEPLITVARANVPAVLPVPISDIVTTPPAMLAQTVVPIAPAPAPVATIVPGSIVRAVTPNGTQPGVLWVVAMGAILCRIGARLLRVS
jgi:hypothetical protein